MDYERLARKLLGGDAGKIGKPVVGVDDVEFFSVLHRNGAAHLSIAGNLFKEVCAVLARELELLAEAYGSLVDRFLLHLLDGLEVLVRIDVRNEA